MTSRQSFLIFLTATLLLVGSSVVAVNPTETSITPTKIINKDRPNVIFLVGDGMGPEEVKAASIVEYGAPNMTIMDTEFPVHSRYTTDDIDGKVTDSAAGGTALATGQLTRSGYVGMNENADIYYKNILEYLKYDFGYKSGLVTTTELAHATPATFSVHVRDRNDYPPILKQMFDHKIDVLLAGGLQVSYLGSVENVEKIASDNNYEAATTLSQLESKKSTAERLFGIFGHKEFEPNMPYEYERDTSVDPSIVDMTDAAIQVLSSSDDPFFLMVEGGRIDHAGHLSHYTAATAAEKIRLNVIETIMFEKAVRKAYDFAKADGNTIIVVGADHETGGLTVYDYNNLNSTLPSSDANRNYNLQLRAQRAEQLNVSWYWTSHTGTAVPFYGYGSDFGNYDVTVNTDVFFALNNALGSFPVINSHKYSEGTDQLTITTSITDLDNSATGIEVMISYDNGSDKYFSYTPDGSISGTHEITVPLDPSQDYDAKFRVLDSDENDVYAFDTSNKLEVQTIESPQSTSSISSSSSSTNDDAPYLSWYLFVAVIVPTATLVRNRRSYRISNCLL